MAATYDSFASSRYNKFIAYTPPQPRTSQRAASKEFGTSDAEWTDIDELIKNFADHDHSLDELAAAPLLHNLDTGTQVEELQNAPESIEENDGNGIPVESGMPASVARLSVPTLSSKNDAPVLHATLDDNEARVTEQHDRQPASPDMTAHLTDGTTLEPAIQLNRVDERLNGASLADPVHILQKTDERQKTDAGEPIGHLGGGSMKRRKRSNVAASDDHIDSEDESSPPPDPSTVANESPSSPDNSTSDACLSAYLSEDAADEELELHQAKRARWRGKQHKLHGRKELTASTSTKRRGLLYTRSNIPPKRSSQRFSNHLDTNADTSQSLLDYGRPDVRPVPQKLTQITLRTLASGETFVAAVIQDERKVASFAYDQTMQMIKRSVGCGQEIDKLAVMSIMLNSWLVTGFLRPADQQNQLGTFDGTEPVIDPANEWQATVPSNSHTEDIDPDIGLGDLLDEAVFLARERDGSAEDDLYSSGGESDKHKVTVRRQRRPWEAFEEDILKKYAKHKSWVEIGELLKRSPGAVSQHWRLMQQDTKEAEHTGQLTRKRRRGK